MDSANSRHRHPVQPSDLIKDGKFSSVTKEGDTSTPDSIAIAFGEKS